MKLVTERKGSPGKGNGISSNWHIIEITVAIFLNKLKRSAVKGREEGMKLETGKRIREPFE